MGKGRHNFKSNSFLIIFASIVIVGVTAGSVYAVNNDFFGNVRIFQDGDGKGNLVLTDGLIIATGRSDGTPTQIIDAKSSPGNDAIFRVTGDGGNSIFTIASGGGQPTLALRDDDTNQRYQLRIVQPDTDRLDLVDVGAGESRISVMSDGKVGINNTAPQEALDVNGNIHLSGASVKITSDGDICIGAC